MEEHVHTICKKLKPVIEAIVGTEALRPTADVVAERDTEGHAVNEVSPIVQVSGFFRSYWICRKCGVKKTGSLKI